MAKEENWINPLDELPKEAGYYYTYYLNRDGNCYFKALGYNPKKQVFELLRNKYYEDFDIRVIDNDCLMVYKWAGPKYDFYVPCMLREKVNGRK